MITLSAAERKIVQRFISLMGTMRAINVRLEHLDNHLHGAGAAHDPSATIREIEALRDNISTLMLELDAIAERAKEII